MSKAISGVSARTTRRATRAVANGAGPLVRLRGICLAFPDATEKVRWEITPTFRARDKMLAVFGVEDGRESLTCKAPPGGQGVLVGVDPERFFVPRSVGQHGWIGVRPDLPDVDWELVAELVEDSYRMTAPKRLLVSEIRPGPGDGREISDGGHAGARTDENGVPAANESSMPLHRVGGVEEGRVGAGLPRPPSK
jgi:predicted DNA-binding protein (MmcQ/YjbR family)